MHSITTGSSASMKLDGNSLFRVLKYLGSDIPLASPLERTPVDSDMAGRLGSDVVRRGKCTQCLASLWT